MSRRPVLARPALWAGLGFSTVFAGLWAAVRSGLARGPDDAAILAATNFTRDHPRLLTALVRIEWWFQPHWTIPVSGLLIAFVVLRHRRLWRRGVVIYAGMLACWGLTNVVKVLVHRERPVVTDAVAHAPGYSFPSGHASGAAAVAVGLLLFAWPLLAHRALAVVAVAAGAAMIVVVDLDRVFLGVHFPTDVLAGTVFGAGLVTVAALMLPWPDPPTASERPVAENVPEEHR